jgi:hypothetical protein
MTDVGAAAYLDGELFVADRKWQKTYRAVTQMTAFGLLEQYFIP